MKIKKFLSVLSAAVMLLGAFALTAAAEVRDTTKDVTLTIYALATDDEKEVTLDSTATGEKITIEGRTPISGVSFRLYRENDDGSVGDEYILTDPSDENGCTTVVIPAAQQGRYSVLQDGYTEGSDEQAIPFEVDLPMTDPSGTGFMYSVYAYPKLLVVPEPEPEPDTESDVPVPTPDTDSEDEEIIPKPEVSKKVSGDNGKTWGERANIASISGQKAYWKITSKVPANISRINVFRVGDVLDNRLVPPKASEVKASVEGKELDSSLYTVTVKDRTVTVNFEERSLDKYADGSVDVIFPTAIDLTAKNAVGEMIENMATLTFSRIESSVDSDSTDSKSSDDDVSTDSDGSPSESPTTTISTTYVEVWTGEIRGYKHDNNNKAVSGAEFTLYSDKECRNSIAKAASDKDGNFVFTGLTDGTYYIKETKTPDGYRENENTLSVTLKRYQKEPATIDVLNIKKENLPVTGGAGIIGISLLGILAAAFGCVLIRLAFKARKAALSANA